MKALFRWSALGATAALLLTGCGSSESGTVNPTVHQMKPSARGMRHASP